MYLTVILAVAVLFLEEDRGEAARRFLGSDAVWPTLGIVWGVPLLLGGISWLLARRVRKRLADRPALVGRLHHRHRVHTLVLRCLLLAGFAGAVLGTPWPKWMAFGRVHPTVQIVGDVIVLLPFVVGLLLLWTGDFVVETAVRRHTRSYDDSADGPDIGPSTLPAYLDFHLRHHLLVAAVPLLMILFASHLVRAYEDRLQQWMGWTWAPELMLGTSALLVFLVAPALLVRIWRTSPLPPGPVRDRLERVCEQTGVRCRDILVWHSGGWMINAAVLGVWAPLRYVLLSDALLETMTPEQIQAVFGHEAGHVRHHHIPFFLLFAFVGWLVVTGITEALLWWSVSTAGTGPRLSVETVEGIGIAATVCIWGLGFGWLSRRFERQADLVGARCAAPPAEACRLPCSVHPDEADGPAASRGLCATGVAIFTSALERVAALNGIPQEERSWRHSSIGSRIRFLHALAGDPGRVVRFERLVRRVQSAMLAAAVLGGLVWIVSGGDATPGGSASRTGSSPTTVLTR